MSGNVRQKYQPSEAAADEGNGNRQRGVPVIPVPDSLGMSPNGFGGTPLPPTPTFTPSERPKFQPNQPNREVGLPPQPDLMRTFETEQAYTLPETPQPIPAFDVKDQPSFAPANFTEQKGPSFSPPSLPTQPSFAPSEQNNNVPKPNLPKAPGVNFENSLQGFQSQDFDTLGPSLPPLPPGLSNNGFNQNHFSKSTTVGVENSLPVQPGLMEELQSEPTQPVQAPTFSLPQPPQAVVPSFDNTPMEFNHAKLPQPLESSFETNSNPGDRFSAQPDPSSFASERPSFAPAALPEPPTNFYKQETSEQPAVEVQSENFSTPALPNAPDFGFTQQTQTSRFNEAQPPTSVPVQPDQSFAPPTIPQPPQFATPVPAQERFQPTEFEQQSLPQEIQNSVASNQIDHLKQATGGPTMPPPPPGFGQALPAEVKQPNNQFVDFTPHVETTQQTQDAPAPEAAPPELVEPDPLPHVVAYSGTLDMPMVHSICSLNLRPNYDEINPALAVFGKLDKGEFGFIHLATRPASPDTLQKTQTMLMNMNSGQPIEEKKGSLALFNKYFKFLIDYLFYVMSSSRGKVAPQAPWKPQQDIKPPPRYTVTEEEKFAIKFAEEKVQARRYFESKLYIGTIGPKEKAEELKMVCQELQSEFNASYSNGATGQGFVYKETDELSAIAGLLPVNHFDNCILSPHEMGEMMKVPDSQTGSHAVNIDRGMKSVPPRRPIIVPDPLNPPPGILAFGEIHVGSSKQSAIGMPIKGLNTHMYLCGTTGSGKSTILEWFIYGLAKNGKSIFVVDPHGTLVDNSLKSILAYAPERAKDCLILDFGDSEHPVSFNPIAISSQTEIEPTTNSVKEMILKMLGLNPDSAPRAVNYVEQAVWAMAECNLRAFGDRKDLALTLLQVPDFFTNTEFRQLVVQFCTNLSIRSTFDPDGPFEKLGERQQLDHVMPVLRTFSSLAVKDSFGNIFGQSESKIDFTKWIREKKIVLMKLPAIASDASVATFIGAMVTPMIIASTAKWGHDKDLSAYLMIDEFQNYATESYESLLAQTRKYGLHGISANQIPQQLPPKVLQGVQSNTQTKISMRLDPAAVNAVASFIASGQPHPRNEDILALPNYWGWANHMMDDGTTSGPFVFKGLSPPYDEACCDPEHPAWLKGMTKERLDEGFAYYNDLLPKVVQFSRLDSAAPRDLVWEKRQNHLIAARTVLEQKIQDKMRSGGYDGASASLSEEVMHDQQSW